MDAHDWSAHAFVSSLASKLKSAPPRPGDAADRSRPSSPPSGFQKLLDDAMRPAILAALLLLLAAAASPAAALYSAGSPVLQLNPNNFKKVSLLPRIQIGSPPI